MLGEPKVTFIDWGFKGGISAPQSLERAVRQRLQTMAGDLFHSPDYGIPLTSLLKPRKP
jgi:phage baseplate assembly protein W